jgi:hypothetical protein
MTYCVGVLLNNGIVFASDSRTHAGFDNFATFCKMTVFERVGDHVIVLPSSGNLAGTQAVISVLRQRGEEPETGVNRIWNARTMFDVAVVVWPRVQAVCNFVNRHITFGYQFARPTKTAWKPSMKGKAFVETSHTWQSRYAGVLVFPHAIAPDIWAISAFLPWMRPWTSRVGVRHASGAWYTFDARNNTPRIGRVLTARGRDAADVAISTTFGPNVLEGFRIWADELRAA